MTAVGLGLHWEWQCYFHAASSGTLLWDINMSGTLITDSGALVEGWRSRVEEHLQNKHTRTTSEWTWIFNWQDSLDQLLIHLSPHPFISSSSHLLISPPHLLTFSSSHLSSPHSLISSPHPLISSSFHLLILSSHLLTLSSPHPFISSSSHLLILLSHNLISSTFTVISLTHCHCGCPMAG